MEEVCSSIYRNWGMGKLLGSVGSLEECWRVVKAAQDGRPDMEDRECSIHGKSSDYSNSWLIVDWMLKGVKKSHIPTLVFTRVWPAPLWTSKSRAWLCVCVCVCVYVCLLSPSMYFCVSMQVATIFTYQPLLLLVGGHFIHIKFHSLPQSSNLPHMYS